jgi:AcrR family transcriptional regulator
LARKAALTSGKKDELIAVALKLFIANGYDSTSVRSILDAVNGEVGMFYHYFRSKDEIFEASVDLYLKQYSEKFADASAGISDISKQVNAVADLAERTILNFNKLGGQHLHWSVAMALHQRTLLAILPSLEGMIEDAIKTKKVTNPLGMSAKELSSFLLFGISGILHQKPIAQLAKDELTEMRGTVKSLIVHTLGIDKELKI